MIFLIEWYCWQCARIALQLSLCLIYYMYFMLMEFYTQMKRIKHVNLYVNVGIIYTVVNLYTKQHILLPDSMSSNLIFLGNLTRLSLLVILFILLSFICCWNTSQVEIIFCFGECEFVGICFSSVRVFKIYDECITMFKNVS